MATVHPYKGYLNSNFNFYAKGTEDISYNIVSLNNEHKDSIQTGIFSPNIPYSVNIKEAGSYRIDFNDGTSANIIVEDGYKFGGSKHKQSFIFDNCPWLFIIMNDRTYFYNKETDVSYVEAISPDKVDIVSADYVIFSNSNQEERTIYSLVDQKPILNVSNIIYQNEEVILWWENEEIISFSLKNNAYISRISPLQYLIDKENRRLLYVVSQTIFVFNLFDDYQVNELYHCNGKFQAFIDNKYSVYSYNDKQYSYLQVVNHKSNELIKEIIVEGFISSVNGMAYININERRSSIRDFDLCKNGLPEASISACYHDFIFYPCDWDIYYLERITTFTKNLLLDFNEKNECKLHSLGTDLNQPFNFSNNTAITTHKRFLLFNSNESYVQRKFHDAAGYTKDGYIHIHKNTIILEKDHCVYTLSPNGFWDNRIECDYGFSMFESYGIVKDKKTGIYESFYHNIKGKDYICKSNPVSHIELGNSIILEGGKIYFNKSDLHQFSINPIAVSPNITHGIIIEDDKVYLLDISSREEIRKQILSDIFDASKYHDVILGEDGSQILYRNSKTTRVTDVISGETFDFGNMSYIQQTNGIRTHFQRSGALQPRIVSPITGLMLDAKQMKQYDFVSPNGRFYADAQLDQYIEYYWHSTNELLSKDEYLNICKMYTYPWKLDKNSQKFQKINSLRKKLVIDNFLFLNKKYPNVFKNDKTGEKWEEYVLDNKNKFDISRFIDLFIGKRGIAVIRCTSDRSIFAKINLGDPLWFINYVSFSYDNKFVAIAGRYPNDSGKGGLFLIYDLHNKKVIIEKTNSWAVWLTSFNKKGQVAGYSSEPIAYNALCDNEDTVDFQEYKGYNFLTFSPDGKLTALSNQGYVSKICKDGTHRQCWGHRLSSNVYISYSNNMGNIIKMFEDLSQEGIEGCSDKRHNFPKTVASVSFSNDNKRLMMVGNDGVVIIRNLHLEKYANK